MSEASIAGRNGYGVIGLIGVECFPYISGSIWDAGGVDEEVLFELIRKRSCLRTMEIDELPINAAIGRHSHYDVISY